MLRQSLRLALRYPRFGTALPPPAALRNGFSTQTGRRVPATSTTSLTYAPAPASASTALHNVQMGPSSGSQPLAMDKAAYRSLTRMTIVWATSVSIWGLMMYIFGTSAWWWYQADQALKSGIPFEQWVDMKDEEKAVALSAATVAAPPSNEVER